MPFPIQVQDAVATARDEITLTDRSGAHVDLTLLIGREPPIRHAFNFHLGTVTIPLPALKAGRHACTLVAQVFKHKHSMSRRFDVACAVGGTTVASAAGDVPRERNNDFGIGDFTLTVP